MKVRDIFKIKYGVNLELDKLNIVSKDEPGVNFVARTSRNNGVVARVALIDGVKPNPAGTLSCAGGGSVLSTFVQEEPYYSGRDLYILEPISNMTIQVKLFYAYLIGLNKYKYSYGRQANRTLGEIELPTKIPDWVHSFDLSEYYKLIVTNVKSSPETDTYDWLDFRLMDIFNFSKGKRLTKEDMSLGKLNYIGAISENNGIRQKIDGKPTHKGNCITVNYNGSVGEAFYQKEEFWASDDVNILRLKSTELILTKYIALFICTVIKANKYRFGYGRKWTLEKMKESIIKLPATKQRLPDWEFMESYIKSLPYSDKI